MSEFKTLREYLEKHPFSEGFKSKPFYSPDGDYIARHMTDEPYYAEQIDKLITIYRSMDTNEFVGYQIHGISCLPDAIED